MQLQACSEFAPHPALSGLFCLVSSGDDDDDDDDR
jgi:hypothetical protein